MCKILFIHSLKHVSSNSTDIKYLVNMLQSNKITDGMSIYVCRDLIKFFVKII